MRLPSIRNPQSIWDILAVLGLYLLIEYIVLQRTGSLLIRQELVVVGAIVALWALWAIFRILGKASELK